MLTWRNEYSVGVEVLDNQHKFLFELGNKALNMLKNDDSSNSYDEVMSIFEELKNYTIYHFSSEEEYMLQRNFDGYLDHKREHADFIEKLDKMNFDELNFATHIQEILRFIINWVFNHILKVDLLYRQ
jgi:hemerythrin